MFANNQANDSPHRHLQSDSHIRLLYITIFTYSLCVCCEEGMVYCLKLHCSDCNFNIQYVCNRGKWPDGHHSQHDLSSIGLNLSFSQCLTKS